jgi:hypothetical protein
MADLSFTTVTSPTHLALDNGPLPKPKAKPAKGLCRGKMENGPGKAYAKCGLCGALDYEANEGDTCRRRV